MQNVAPGSSSWFVAESAQRNAAAKHALKRAWYATLGTVFWLAVMVHVEGWPAYVAFGLAFVCAYQVFAMLQLAWNERSAASIAADMAVPVEDQCPTCKAPSKPWVPFTGRDTVRR